MAASSRDRQGKESLRGNRLPVERQWPLAVRLLVQLAIVVVVLVAWEAGAALGWIDTFFWSRPTAIWRSLVIFVTSGGGWLDVWYTLQATLLGFAIGTVLGAVLGLSFWWSKNFAAIIQPFIISFEATPKLALAPLIVLVFGTGLPSKVAIGAALTIVVTTLTTGAGVSSLDLDLERLFYSLGASRTQVFFKLVVPSALPWIISVLRINIGLALTGSVVGEFIASTHGLGRQIVYASETYNIDLIWVAVLVLSSLSIAMYVAVSYLERVLIKGVAHGVSSGSTIHTTS